MRCVARALRPVECRPTAHRARAARTWSGCVVGQRRARSSPRRRPGLDRSNTATGRRHASQETLIIAFESRGARRVRSSPRGKSADRPRSTRRAAWTGRGCVVGCGPTRGALPPHAVSQGSTASTPRQVGGTAFKRSSSLRSNPMARVARALRPVENRPTAHGARAAQRGLGDLAWLCCWPTWGALPSTPSAGAQPHQHRDRSASRPLRSLVTSFESCGARRARSSPRGELTDHPRSTRHAARTWRLGVVVSWANAGRAPFHAVGRGSTAPTPRQVGGTAFDRLHRPRLNPVACVARAFHPMENRPTSHGVRAAHGGLGVVVLWANAGRAPPHAAVRGLSAPAPRQVGGSVFRGY